VAKPKFMIHACPDRMWYVEDFLVPSMRAQGITNITIWNDKDGIGCLDSCMKSFESCEGDGGTWHLQDDVLICHDFAYACEEYDEGVACGFCHILFEPFNRPVPGEAPPIYMFNSFPCIRIPDPIARECAEWYYTDAQFRPEYQDWVKSKKHDDGFWHDFYVERHPRDWVMNLVPALVEHVDWLIGGSVVNDWRGYICRATYWEDEDLVTELKAKLAHR